MHNPGPPSLALRFSTFNNTCFIKSLDYISSYENVYAQKFNFSSPSDIDSSLYFHFSDYNSEFDLADSISRTALLYSSFDKSKFRDSLFVFNDGTNAGVNYSDSEIAREGGNSQLGNSLFSHGASIFLDPENTPTLYNLSLYNLDNLNLRLTVNTFRDTARTGRVFMLCIYDGVVNSRDAADFYSASLAFIDRLRTHVINYNTSDNDKRDAVTAKVEYWRNLVSMDNLLSLKGTGALPAWMMDWWIRRLVNFGYRGTFPFLTSALFFIFLFGILFFADGRYKIAHYILLDGEIKKDFETDYSRHLHLLKTKKAGQTGISTIARHFTESVWLSALIFINPRFPNKYFHIKGRLFLWILICWAMGQAMLILFLIYIASQASFLKAIFAM